MMAEKSCTPTPSYASATVSDVSMIESDPTLAITRGNAEEGKALTGLPLCGGTLQQKMVRTAPERDSVSAPLASSDPIPGTRAVQGRWVPTAAVGIANVCRSDGANGLSTFHSSRKIGQ